MSSNKPRSRIGIYITILATVLAKASSIHIKSFLRIHSSKLQVHPTKICEIDQSLILRDSSSLLRFRGGSDRDGGYSSGAHDYDYNYVDRDRDRSTSRNDSQDRYEDDYYGKGDEKGRSFENYEQNNDYRREEYDDYRRDKHSDNQKETKYPWKSTKKSSSMSFLPDIIRSGNKKVGFGLLGGGLILTILGVTLFFNKTLMRLGNLLFMAGIPMTIGPERTLGYFLQPKKVRATGCLAVGIFLVMIGWPIFGIVLEIFGIMNLFGNMFPLLKVLLRQVPLVGGIFDDGSKSKKKRKPQNRKYDEDREYYPGRDDERHDGDRNEGDSRYEQRYRY